MKRKPILSSKEILEHMKNKGILFNIVKEDDARHFIEEHNYYFKLASYRKNYDKIPNGQNKDKYINLEFAYLQELSKMDMYLRYLILELSLDIEHAIKVALINDISKNKNEDGYEIIELFDPQKNCIKKAKKFGEASYAAKVVAKYSNKCPIWAFCEVISFGDLCKLANFYNHFYPKSLAFKTTLLYPVRDIRNASAHSNCIINDLRDRSNVPNNEVSNFVAKVPGITKTRRQKMLKNKSIHDFVALIMVYDQTVMSEMQKAKCWEKLDKVFNKRFLSNNHFFVDNETIRGTYSFLRKVIRKIKNG